MTKATKELPPSPEPEHVKIYAPAIAPINSLIASHRRVLYAILSEVSSAENGMRVAITAGVKRRMCQELGVKNPQTISNALSKMVKAGILIRIETGIYMLNPFLFGKGDWKDIQKLRLGVGGSF
jgi:hypothetical protein